MKYKNIYSMKVYNSINKHLYGGVHVYLGHARFKKKLNVTLKKFASRIRSTSLILRNKTI